jgi:hypothetical protein
MTNFTLLPIYPLVDPWCPLDRKQLALLRRSEAVEVEKPCTAENRTRSLRLKSKTYVKQKNVTVHKFSPKTGAEQTAETLLRYKTEGRNVCGAEAYC